MEGVNDEVVGVVRHEHTVHGVQHLQPHEDRLTLKR